MVVAYWLAVQPKLQTKQLPPRNIIRHRLYYPGMLPATVSEGAAHYVNDPELDFFHDAPVLEQVMAAMWREFGSAYVGKANNYGPQSGVWGGRKRIYTKSGSISEMIQYLQIEAKADLLKDQIKLIEDEAGISQLQKEVLKAKKRNKKLAAELNEKVKLLRKEQEPQIKPLKSQLKGVGDLIKKELAEVSGSVIHHVFGDGNAAVRDVLSVCYDTKLIPPATKPNLNHPRKATRFPYEVLRIYNDLRRRYPDQRDLDTYLLERQNFPNQSELRNALRALNRRTYERRVCNTVV